MNKLKRNISLSTGIAIAISMVIGSGLFALPGLSIEATDPITAFIGWLVVILIMPPMIYIFSFLGRKFPLSGGVTLYASHAFGKWSEGGFSLIICGALAVGMPAFFMVGGAYLAELFYLNPEKWTIPLAIILAISSTFMNIIGINKVGWINKFVVVLILLLLVILIILEFPSYNSSKILIEKELTEYQINLGMIWLAASIVFWAFQGWENMSFGLEEFDNPDRSIPIVFWGSFSIISIIYIVFALVSTLASLKGGSITGLSGLTELMGEGISRQVILTLTVLVLIANANSWVFGASRAFFSAANQGVMFKKLSNLSDRGLPIVSLISTLVLYILIMVSMWVMNIHAKYAFLLTTQGFIILYGASIISFYKSTQGVPSIVISILAIASWLFLMHGFGMLIIYPISLFLVGITIQARTRAIMERPEG